MTERKVLLSVGNKMDREGCFADILGSDGLSEVQVPEGTSYKNALRILEVERSTDSDFEKALTFYPDTNSVN